MSKSKTEQTKPVAYFYRPDPFKAVRLCVSALLKAGQQEKAKKMWEEVRRINAHSSEQLKAVLNKYVTLKEVDSK